MLKKFEEVELELNKVLDKHSQAENAGEIVNATDLALNDLKALLNHFKDNFLDKNGKVIKISIWKWIFVKEYRTKIINAIDYLLDTVKLIVSRY